MYTDTHASDIKRGENSFKWGKRNTYYVNLFI